jgi:hypothetical protein
VGELRVVDDGPEPVTFFSCTDAGCRIGSSAQHIAPGGQLVTAFELCDGGSVAITGADGVLRGCLVLPVGEDQQQVTYRVGQFAAGCEKGETVRPRIS